MGEDPNAADNRWLRDAMENRVPVIYFLGVAPGVYQAIVPAFIVDWDPRSLKSRVAFGSVSDTAVALPETDSNGAMLCGT
jgi:putative restriction endonuclease